jgi:hypothetical protein
MKKLSMYPIVELVSTPENVNEEICNYCREKDLHPHNGTYIDYNVSYEFPNSNSPIDMWLYSVGIRQEHEKVLIHFDY